jgi:hypothetical protein
MKKLLFILVTGVSLLTFSCKKEAIQQNATAQGGMTTGGSGPAVKTTPYVWKINSFVSGGMDMTAQFANFEFDIRAPQLMIADGEILAVSGGTTYHGKWHRVDYDEVVITFPVDPSSVLNQLNADWTLTNNLEHDIAMQSGSKMLSFHNDGETWPTE